VVANPLWRAPRIHSELKMLGILISERTYPESCAAFRDRPVRRGRPFCTIISARWSRLTFLALRRIATRCWITGVS
jgi:hypothetical protein